MKAENKFKSLNLKITDSSDARFVPGEGHTIKFYKGTLNCDSTEPGATVSDLEVSRRAS